jgi:hypothetical protein
MGKRIDGLTVDGLRVDRAAGHLIELRAEGSATLTDVDAAGVADPAVLTCAAFVLNWRGTTAGVASYGAHSC